MYGGNAKGPDSGDVTPFPYSMLAKVDESDHRALERDSRFYYPAYMGPSGWLGLDFTAAEVDCDEVRELVDASYRLVAPKKLIKEPDSR
jgi:predicted DNA-binding protein (MmcQ/YjbR family)